MSADDLRFMARAMELAREAERAGEVPVGAVIVRDGAIVGEGWNRPISTNDPTAHAEVVAIRKACQALGSFQLDDCEIYCSCEPCPMCLGAIYWSRPKAIYYANTKTDAAAIDFDDAFIYAEIDRPIEQREVFTRQLMREEALVAFEKWRTSTKKIEY